MNCRASELKFYKTHLKWDEVIDITDWIYGEYISTNDSMVTKNLKWYNSNGAVFNIMHPFIIRGGWKKGKRKEKILKNLTNIIKVFRKNWSSSKLEQDSLPIKYVCPRTSLSVLRMLRSQHNQHKLLLGRLQT